MTAYEKELKVAREAAALAGRLCLAVRKDTMGARPETIEKAGREPVTIADYASQAVVHHYIKQNFPDDRTISEERSSDFNTLAGEGQQERVLYYACQALGTSAEPEDLGGWLDFGRESESSRVWTVDPIDGTKGFIRGDQFAVAISLIVDGELTVGVLGTPKMPFSESEDDSIGLLTSAVRGEGAYATRVDGSDERRIHVSKEIDAAKMRVLESVEAAHTDHDFSATLLKQAGVRGGSVRIDSQAKYAAVADGRAEIYIRSVSKPGYREKIWDHAAGALIVQEAGGTVTDLDGNPLDFSLGERLFENSGIVASNGPLHHVLIEQAKEVGGLR